MPEATDRIYELFTPDTVKAVLSEPEKGAAAPKVTLMKVRDYYQAESVRAGQAFHENLDFAAARDFVASSFARDYRQLNMWAGDAEYGLRLSKKGKLLMSRGKASAPPKARGAHNREKNYIVSEAIPPLIDMGIFTPDGRIVSRMYDKFKQINRFIELIDDELSSWPKEKPLRVIDFGCGKSYLTFVIYHYLINIKGFDARITGLDLKSAVIASCNAAAKKYGYDRLDFQVGDIAGWQGEGADMVVSLHACDTATDYALYNAIKWGAKYIFSVPCCQHELAPQMKNRELSLLTRYGVVRERTAALMTDAIRADLVTACGYRTQLLEFVDLAHTPKNLLLRAVKTNVSGSAKAEALAETKRLTETFGLRQTLDEMLREGGYI